MPLELMGPITKYIEKENIIFKNIRTIVDLINLLITTRGKKYLSTVSLRWLNDEIFPIQKYFTRTFLPSILLEKYRTPLFIVSSLNFITSREVVNCSTFAYIVFQVRLTDTLPLRTIRAHAENSFIISAYFVLHFHNINQTGTKRNYRFLSILTQPSSQK